MEPECVSRRSIYVFIWTLLFNVWITTENGEASFEYGMHNEAINDGCLTVAKGITRTSCGNLDRELYDYVLELCNTCGWEVASGERRVSGKSMELSRFNDILPKSLATRGRLCSKRNVFSFPMTNPQSAIDSATRNLDKGDRVSASILIGGKKGSIKKYDKKWQQPRRWSMRLVNSQMQHPYTGLMLGLTEADMWDLLLRALQMGSTNRR